MFCSAKTKKWNVHGRVTKILRHTHTYKNEIRLSWKH